MPSFSYPESPISVAILSESFLQKLAEMRDAVQAIVIPSSDVLSEQLQAEISLN